MTDWTQVPFCEYLSEINRLSMKHYGCTAYMDSVAYWKEQFDERRTPMEAMKLQLQRLQSKETIMRKMDVITEWSTNKPKTYMGLCPFHTEKTPSSFYKPSEDKFTCLGCGKETTGDEMVAQIEKAKHDRA